MERTVRKVGRLAPLASMLFLALVSSAWGGEWKGSCDIRVLGSSTLHDFTGDVRCQPFRIDVDDAGGGKPAIAGADVAVLVDEIDTGNKTRDRQMRTMFQSDLFPEIRGIFGNIDPKISRLEFKLRIRGAERTIRTVVSGYQEQAGRVSFDAEFPVSLKDYRLVPPTVAFGLIRVDDKVTVKVAVRLEAVPGQ